MSFVPDGRAANHPLSATTFSPPLGAPLPGAWVSGSALVRSLMVLQYLRLGAVEDFLGTGYFIHGAVRNQHKLVGLKRRLVPQDAVLGDPEAVQAGSNRAQTAYHDGAFQRPNDPSDERPRYYQRPDAGNQKECRTEQHSPYPAPEGAHFSPVFHALPGIVVADHMFIGVIVASNNRQFLQIETGLL